MMKVERDRPLGGAEEIMAALASTESLPYLGEPVSQLFHALQAGFQARAAGDDDELVLAAVLHDVGRAPGVAVRGAPHEEAGAAWLAPLLGERVAYLVESHVPAKRVLVATEPGYVERLSATSEATLRVQGGPATVAEVVVFMAHPWAPDALALRRADEAAKDPEGPALSLAEVAELLESCVGESVSG